MFREGYYKIQRKSTIWVLNKGCENCYHIWNLIILIHWKHFWLFIYMFSIPRQPVTPIAGHHKFLLLQRNAMSNVILMVDRQYLRIWVQKIVAYPILKVTSRKILWNKALPDGQCEHTEELVIYQDIVLYESVTSRKPLWNMRPSEEQCEHTDGRSDRPHLRSHSLASC